MTDYINKYQTIPLLLNGNLEDLIRIFEDSHFGYAIIHKDMRFLRGNARMAEICEVPAGTISGKTLNDIWPDIEPLISSMITRSIKNGKSVIDEELMFMRPGGGMNTDERCWLVSSYPFSAENRNNHMAILVVKDVTEQKKTHLQLDERMRFEALLAELSAEFINVMASDMDMKIVQGLEKVTHFLKFDRITIWNVSPEDGKGRCAFSFSLPGIKNPPPVLDELVPAWVSMGKKGEMFYSTDTDELPDEQRLEKKYCMEQGIRAIFFFPMRVSGKDVGTMSLVSKDQKRAWPDEFIQRIRLLGDIFANALARKQSDQKISTAFEEIRQLKDRLEAENLYLADQIDFKNTSGKIVGESDGIRKILQKIRIVAQTGSTVLIQGETGTGKELIAHAIHELSGRKERAMIKVNCAALPATLIESELFGYEKGAYTGAVARQIGRFEAADGSTIFLDEIGELPMELQAKLLRVLQEGQFERLGSPRQIKIDTRVIAATNLDLSKAVRDGRFREDLYYRLNVFPVTIPPLRERKEDIPLLVWAMIRDFEQVFGKQINRIPRKCMDSLTAYSFPGNVRELRNMVERAMILSRGSTLVVEIPENGVSSKPRIVLHKEMERNHILSVLKLTNWRIRGKNGASEVLGIKPTTLESKMKKLGINRHNISDIS